jgi:RNA polymerase sigma factor (sigma-70 family)
VVAKKTFPSTHWSQLVVVKDGMTAERREALNFLIERYWRPAYCFVRRRGHGDEESKDLVQEFFAEALTKEFFAKANQTIGRFRNFLLRSLKNFLANAHREAHANKRQPEGGIVAIEDLIHSDGFAFEPVESETPDEIFHRAWLTDLIRRVLRSLELECLATRKEKHYELFRRRIIMPALEGTELPPLRELGQSLSMSEKEAANALITARRAYQRLLREEIRLYSTTEEDVAAEIQDLFHFLSQSHHSGL